jgi:outer membrane protein OmpA-like peptidoglycan-associated protein
MVANQKQKRIVYTLLAVGLLLVVPQLFGCGGQIAFTDTSAIAIEGTPPPPPPPPPEAAPAPKRVEVTADRIEIKEKIQFDFGKATIKPESFSLLSEIASVIKANPQIRKISIEGHTDNVGGDKYNLKLSDERTAAVKKHLIEQGGLPEAMLDSKGWGKSKPIASNDTEEGREKNRRVEFLITAQDEVKKVIEIDQKTGAKREVSKTVTPTLTPLAEKPAEGAPAKAMSPKEEKAEKAKKAKEEREEKAKKAKEEREEKAKKAKELKQAKAEKADKNDKEAKEKAK